MNATQTVGADWELDFYSRPILEADGRKRWELLVTATPAADATEIPFRFSKCCPSGEVNSLWLTAALAKPGSARWRQAGQHPDACAAGAAPCERWFSGLPRSWIWR